MSVVGNYAQLFGALSGREALLHALKNIDVPLVFNCNKLGRNSTTIQRIQHVLCGSIPSHRYGLYRALMCIAFVELTLIADTVIAR